MNECKGETLNLKTLDIYRANRPHRALYILVERHLHIYMEQMW